MGGFLRQLVWNANGTVRTSQGTGSNGWNGFGYVVNHYGSSADLSKNRLGTYRTVLSGAHHAVHEFKVRMQPGGPVDVTVLWSFATGRSHPLYAISFDASPSAANVVRADTRAPYGTLAFEGTPGEIGGIGWGDKYRFTTLGQGPVTLNSTWDYQTPNAVPYVRMWSSNVDAEMGAVQTETFDKHVGGGDYGYGTLGTACWGKTSTTKGPGCSPSGQTMPTDWMWPFQLNQYELPSTTSSHRMAWGSNYGAVGQTTVQSFGKTFSGYPVFSYAVFFVVGLRSSEATLAQAAFVERAAGAQLASTEGSTPRWNPTYASWDVIASNNRATFTVDAKAGALTAPMFRLSQFSNAKVSKVTIEGRPLTENTEFFATIDGANQTAWITLNGTVSGTAVIQLE
jgi:hypothetical protein